MIEFTVGPFAQVGKDLEDFGMNIYFSYVFDESVRQHQKLQEEYIEAFLENDPRHEKSTHMKIFLAFWTQRAYCKLTVSTQ